MDDFERIVATVKSCPHDAIRRAVKVSLDGEAVVLTGTVSSYYIKQLAQETVRSSGRKIVNELKVVADSG